MDKKFLVIVENAIDKEISNWWENDNATEYEAKVFDGFDEAKKFMRQTICEYVKGVEEEFLETVFEGYDEEEDFLDDMFFDEMDETLDDEDEGINISKLLQFGSLFSSDTGAIKIKKLTRDIITDFEFTPNKIENVQETDDADHYQAYVCNERNVLAYNNGFRLEYNVHKMDNEDYCYYFQLHHQGNEKNECVFSIKMMNTVKTIDNNISEIPDKVGCKQIEVGSYMQEINDKCAVQPIIWDVIKEDEDKLLLISHKCLDYRVFNNEKDSVDWGKSEIRKWLNGEFFETAFSDAEKKMILLTKHDDKEISKFKDYVFLLNKEEFMLLDNDNRSALMTKYARDKYSQKLGYKYTEPYAFWWLREPGVDVKGGYDVTHVCANGSLNGFARSDSSHPDGIRPAMWIKKD